MPTPPDLTTLTIAEAASQIASRQVTPSDLTEAYLARIDELNPKINAYITVTADLARNSAAAATAEIASGHYRGALHGIPIGLKDLYETAGIRTTAGSKVHGNYVPENDATVTRMLADAGAILLGKTNTHEYAWGTTTNNPHWGATHNPWDLDRIPGGSSGGSGAAIAARMAAGTLGTDTGGSIRIPAALCGCVGLKPTFGRVSKHGVFPMSWQFDHPGPIVKSVEDAAIVLQAIAGYDPADFSTVPVPVPDYRAALRDGVRGLRIGIPRELFFGLLQDEVREAVEEAIRELGRLGAEVHDIDPGVSRGLTNEAWPLVVAEGQEYHGEAFAAHPEDFGHDLQAVLSQPLPDAIGLTRAYRASYKVKELYRQALEGVDLLVTPTVIRTASIIGEESVLVGDVELTTGGAFASLTMPFNVAGLPALALPCGFDGDGLPISVQLVGRPFDEATVLRAGFAYEQATPWHEERPRNLS